MQRLSDLGDQREAFRVAVDFGMCLGARGESRTDRLAAFFHIGDLGFQCVVAHGGDHEIDNRRRLAACGS